MVGARRAEASGASGCASSAPPCSRACRQSGTSPGSACSATRKERAGVGAARGPRVRGAPKARAGRRAAAAGRRRRAARARLLPAARRRHVLHELRVQRRHLRDSSPSEPGILLPPQASPSCRCAERPQSGLRGAGRLIVRRRAWRPRKKYDTWRMRSAWFLGGTPTSKYGQLTAPSARLRSNRCDSRTSWGGIRGGVESGAGIGIGRKASRRQGGRGGRGGGGEG